jgi:hypothetical protein
MWTFTRRLALISLGFVLGFGIGALWFGAQSEAPQGVQQAVPAPSVNRSQDLLKPPLVSGARQTNIEEHADQQSAPIKTVSGTVKAASADSIVLSGKEKGKDRESTFSVLPRTLITAGGKRITSADLEPGDSVSVRYSEKDGVVSAERVTRIGAKDSMDDVSRLIDKALNGLTPGTIVHNIPKNMARDQDYDIEARVSRLENDTTLSEGLLGPSQPKTIPTGPLMSLQLSGDPDVFTITPTGGRALTVPSEGYADWGWTVRPKKTGRHLLDLTATVRIQIPNHPEEFRDIRVYSGSVDIAVTNWQIAKGFLGDYWQWIVTTLLVPPASYVLSWWWKKRHRTPE